MRVCDLWWMTPTNVEQLSRRIEKVIQEHCAASQQAAAEAVNRAFRVATSRIRRAQPAPRMEATVRQRTPEEIEAVRGQLYRAICQKPGEGMTVLAADLERSRDELLRPLGKLKQMGQVRSVGQRHVTRYFPEDFTGNCRA